MHYTEAGAERPINITLAVERSGVSRRTLYNWMVNGFLPYTQQMHPRESRMVLYSDVELVMRARLGKRLGAPAPSPSGGSTS